MDKCREEFEKWLDDNNMFMNIERRFDQESNTYDCCAIRWIWESWQHQQAKVEELQTLYIQQGINMLKLQKWVDAVKGLAQTLWEKSNEKHKQGKVWESKALGECADEILDVLEQALKGDQYDEHRKKAEEAISKGASLTNHRIEL
ncbi:hypothetical protein B9X54_05950 [Acinetobacter baumannii]|uniref:hypothetical protein n=1 Tax=Acinetobacter baumannii TaxID=470 RepID=UPI000A352AA6|nr:hypothetical protein [Acinetobacter baumannii]OTM17111.1 hypothetical protein B9X54_05950 [Acinetobacter baumannii]